MKINIIKHCLYSTYTKNKAKKLTIALEVTVKKASSRREGQITHRGFSSKGLRLIQNSS